MTSTSLCATCGQLFRLQFTRLGRSPEINRSRITSSSLRSDPRSFSTSRLLSASPPTAAKQSQITPKNKHNATPREYQPKPPPANPAAKEDPKATASEGKEPATQPPLTKKAIVKEVRKRLPNITETYKAYGACEVLVKECARQADYTIPQARQKNVEIPKTKDDEDLGVGTGWWFETLGLTPTFNTWAQITFLHMYLLTCRLRCFPAAHAPVWHQHLLDQFFYVAEERMVITHNIAARSVRTKYLKDLFAQWRGLLVGYDEGLVKGDAVLAAAVWRNVFKADENVDFRGVGEVVSFIRGVLKGLEAMPDEGIAQAEVVFGSPGTERDRVLLRSRLMTESPPEVEERAAKAAQV